MASIRNLYFYPMREFAVLSYSFREGFLIILFYIKFISTSESRKPQHSRQKMGLFLILFYFKFVKQTNYHIVKGLPELSYLH